MKAYRIAMMMAASIVGILFCGCSAKFQYRQASEFDYLLNSTCWARSRDIDEEHPCEDAAAQRDLQECIDLLAETRAPAIRIHENGLAIQDCMENRGWVRGAYVWVID